MMSLPPPDGSAVSSRSSGRVTEAERQRRIAETLALLIRRASREQIIALGQQRWGVARRTMQRYLASAEQRLARLADFDPRVEMGKAIAGYELLFAKLLAAGDLRGARATLDRQVRLLGLSAERLKRTGGRAELVAYLAFMKGERPEIAAGPDGEKG